MNNKNTDTKKRFNWKVALIIIGIIALPIVGVLVFSLTSTKEACPEGIQLDGCYVITKEEVNRPLDYLYLGSNNN